MPDHDQDALAARTARTAELVDRLHEIVVELEAMHPGRKFPLDGHLVGSIGEAAAEAMFAISLQPASTAGHDAVADDGRAVEVKATYGTRGIALRTTSHAAATALIVLQLSRHADTPHEVVYNGPLSPVLAIAGGVQSNGQAHLSLSRLRVLDAAVPDHDRIPFRDLP